MHLIDDGKRPCHLKHRPLIEFSRLSCSVVSIFTKTTNKLIGDLNSELQFVLNKNRFKLLFIQCKRNKQTEIVTLFQLQIIVQFFLKWNNRFHYFTEKVNANALVIKHFDDNFDSRKCKQNQKQQFIPITHDPVTIYFLLNGLKVRAFYWYNKVTHPLLCYSKFRP